MVYYNPKALGLFKIAYSNMISRLFSIIKTFFADVKVELKKVTWPSREETVSYTIAVILFSLAMIIFLGGLDFLFTYLLSAYIL